MNLYLDTPATGHQGRGIGTYTTFLSRELAKLGVIFTAPEQADVLWYPGFSFFAPQLPLLPRAPMVVTIHDCIPLEYPDHQLVGIRGKLALFYQTFALRNASAIVTDSKASRASIAQQFPALPKAKIIPLGVELTPPSPLHLSRFRATHKLPARFIGYVGDINFNKNLPSLVQAAAILKVPLVIVTRSDRHTPTREAVALWYAERFSGANVVYVSLESRSELACLYHQAQVMVTPSYSEGFGLPLLEAMAAGGVTVAVNTSSLPEVGGDVCLYARSPSPQDLAAAISKALALTPSKRAEVVEAGIARAKMFAWSHAARAILEVFKDVIK